MITMDIFNNDAFSVTTMLDPVNQMPTEQGFLGSLDIFASEPVSTDTVAIGKKDGELNLIPTTLRAAPIEMLEPETKNIRNFTIPRIAKGSTIRSHQIANIRPEVGQTEAEAVATVIARDQQRLKQDVEYTWEFHRLGAIQGLLLDADGSVLVDYYDEWDISQPAEIDMDLTTLDDGNLRERIKDQISRPLKRALRTGQTVGRIIGLAGDDFFDALIKNPEVRATYLGWAEAKELRGNSDMPYDTFKYGNVEWINFEGSDNTDIRIDSADAVIFPTGVQGMFRHVKGPGESFETINRMGRDVYPLLVRDKDRDMWVQPEIYSYPLMLNTRPDLILRATVG